MADGNEHPGRQWRLHYCTRRAKWPWCCTVAPSTSPPPALWNVSDGKAKVFRATRSPHQLSSNAARRMISTMNSACCPPTRKTWWSWLKRGGGGAASPSMCLLCLGSIPVPPAATGPDRCLSAELAQQEAAPSVAAEKLPVRGGRSAKREKKTIQLFLSCRFLLTGHTNPEHQHVRRGKGNKSGAGGKKTTAATKPQPVCWRCNQLCGKQLGRISCITLDR